MKKILLSMVVALVAMTASAQMYVGGELGFWRNWQNGANNTTVSVLPEVGYGLTDNIALGVTLGYTYNYNAGTKVNAFKVAPYARYTFLKLDNVNLFLDGGFGFASYKAKVGGVSGDAQNAWEVGVKPGVAVNLTEKVSFVAHVGFLGYRTSDDAVSEAVFGKNGLGFNLDNALTFGLYWNF